MSDFRARLEAALEPVHASPHEIFAPDPHHTRHLGAIDDRLRTAPSVERGELYIDAATTFAQSGRNPQIDRVMESIERAAITDHRHGIIPVTMNGVLRQQFLNDPAPRNGLHVTLAPASAYLGDSVAEAELHQVRAKMTVLGELSVAIQYGDDARLQLASLRRTPQNSSRTLLTLDMDTDRLRSLEDDIAVTGQPIAAGLADSTRIVAQWAGVDDTLTARAERLADTLITAQQVRLGPVRDIIAAHHAYDTPRTRQLAAAGPRIRSVLEGSITRVAGKPYQAAPAHSPAAGPGRTPGPDLAR